MHHTAWTKKASSVPSDRIRPTPPPTSNSGKSSKGKGKGAVAELPKSKAVRHLESLQNGLSVSFGTSQKDPKGGCFCQAREHTLSTYSPLCRTCGLILCEINLPQHSCPHCLAELLTGTQRDSLIARLEEQLAETLTKEALLRERAAEEARRAAGAFPTLRNAVPARTPSPAVPQTRTVMSLNSRTKKVTVSSFSTPLPSPSSSRPASRAESIEEEPLRVGKPPAQVPFVAAAKQELLRPWTDLMDGGAEYIPPPSLDDDEDAKGTGNKRRQNKAKAKKENEEGEMQARTAGSSGVPAITNV